MKKFLSPALFLCLGFLLAGLVSFKGIEDYICKRSTAEVDQETGVYIFIRSKPVKDYDFLGKVNMPEVVWNGKPAEMMSIAVRRAVKQYPNANGIIFQSDNFAKVDAILIKE